MIGKLAIERFKSIETLEIEPNRVNLFIGAPDTGKSTILEALQFLSCLGWGIPIGSSLRLTQELGFQNLFYRGFHDRPATVRIDDKTLSIQLADSHQLALTGLCNGGIGFDGTTGSGDLRWIRYYSYGSAAHWVYPTGGVSEEVQPPSGQNLLYVAKHNQRVYDFLKDLVAQMGYKLRFDSHSRKFYFCEVRADEIVDYSLDLLSDSLKRLFFYGAVVSTSRDAILVMDEPDVYAFPPYPKSLGEMIAFDKTNQFFLTTHNPYFLSAIVEKTPAKELALFVCARNQHGATTATRVARERIPKMIEIGSDVFFNLDELVKD